MPRRTPFHECTEPLNRGLAWKEWAGYAAAANFDRHSEREYFAIRGSAGLLDVTPLYKYEVSGRDAARFLSRVWTRDIAKLKVGRVAYGCMCDGDGKVLDDGTVACLGDGAYRVTSSEAWLGWFERQRRGYEVEIEDSTDRIAALALQGPCAREILAGVTDADLDAMRFFGVAACRIAGAEGWISRTGYTGDLGYELWMANGDAVGVYDALLKAGAPFHMEPIGLDALDVSRIEAGFVLQGIDYVSSRSCLIDARRSTPREAGLGWTVNLDREGWIGRDALIAEREVGPKWALVGLEFDWAELEELHAAYGLPPYLAPVACRSAVPIYDRAGAQVGQATSSTWSPTLKRYLALGQVHAEHGGLGTQLRVEYTVEFERETVAATVVQRPFYDPPQKTATPNASVENAPAQVGT